MLEFDHNLLYYDYRFCHLKTAKIRGQVAPHKPLLLLAILDLVESKIITSPRVELSDELIYAFERNAQLYAQNVKHYQPNIGMPFYHMNSEPFWQLIPNRNGETPNVTSVSGLRRYYSCAKIDDKLFELLQNNDTVTALRTSLIETYFKKD